MKEYITKGPGVGGSTVDFLIGSFLFWKVWAVGAVVSLGYFGGAAIATAAGSGWIYSAGFFAGFVTLEVANRVSASGGEPDR